MSGNPEATRMISASVVTQSALMSRRIRVLHVIKSLNYGGMERILADIVRRTDPSRFDKHVLALSYLGRFSTGLEHAATLHVAKPMSRWSLLWPGTLARQIRRIPPDVVHTHSGVWYKTSLAARVCLLWIPPAICKGNALIGKKAYVSE